MNFQKMLNEFKASKILVEASSSERIASSTVEKKQSRQMKSEHKVRCDKCYTKNFDASQFFETLQPTENVTQHLLKTYSMS